MDEYKKIIRSRALRKIILQTLFWVPTKIMIKIQYKIKLKRWPNLKKPKRFTEKIQVYKVKHKDLLMRKCVDKWEVRKYVSNKGLSNILVKTYGVYDNYESLDTNLLPDSFVVKSTTGGGGNDVVIVKNKSEFNLGETKKIIGKLGKKVKKSAGGREWAYYGLKNRLVVEEYLVNKENPSGGIDDYKFFCFHGEPKYLVIDNNRFISHKRNFYDINWNYLDIKSDHDNFGNVFPKPKNYEEMVEISRILSKDFPFVRVDLYNIEGKIKFGELTFYPWSGYVNFFPDGFDKELGSYFNIK